MDWVKELLEVVARVLQAQWRSKRFHRESLFDRRKRSFRNWRSAYGKSLDGGVEEDNTDE